MDNLEELKDRIKSAIYSAYKNGHSETPYISPVMNGRDVWDEVDYDEIESIINALEAKLAESEWQPIETAPKDGTEILIACQREHRTYMYVAWHEPLDDWWQVTRGNSTVIRNASHWMPLPTTPTQEAQ